jgi:hypothetical protein
MFHVPHCRDGATSEIPVLFEHENPMNTNEQQRSCPEFLKLSYWLLRTYDLQGSSISHYKY